MKRLPASSLIEVTVAAAILVIVFALALAICARLVRQGPSPQRLLARQLIEERAMRTIHARQWLNLTEAAGAILLEQSVTPVPAQPHLYHLRVRALAGDSIVATYQELVYSPPADAR